RDCARHGVELLHGDRRAGTPRRLRPERGAAARAQGPLRPDEPLPAEPEHPTELTPSQPCERDEVISPVLKPSQCILPRYRACSTFKQRSMTTSSPPRSAICAPSGLITPYGSHSAPAPASTASAAIAGTASGARKTSTTSI